jgi:uncharacterized protein (TIGR02996 family)
MTEEDAFLQAIIEAPDDDTHRLVYADWLEEQGDPRAAAIRKHPEVSHFLSGLCQVRGVETSLRQLESWVFGGRADLVRDLRLILKCQPDGPGLRLRGVPDSALERVRRTLFPLPNADGATVVIGQLGGRPPKPDEVRELASRLASEHSPGELLAVLEHYRQDGRFLELLGCLSQEMVLRGVILDGLPAGERIAICLRERMHPLARLPLSLTAVEGDLRPWLPHYGGGGQGWSTPFGHLPQWCEPLPAGPSSGAGAFTETTDINSRHLIASAVLNWEEESNGQWEARVFRAERPISVEVLSLGLLRSLRLDCLEGVSEQDLLAAARVTPYMAFATLFSAASTGGAYNSGLRGAYGRLAAWRSLAGLVGVSGDDGEAVIDLARRCHWVRIPAVSEWFYQVAWDFGLLAVRPDGMSLAVLAATDTD